MLLKRITYGLSLLALALCWILTQRGIFAALLLSCLLLALLSSILFLAAARRVHLRIELPETAVKDTELSVQIQISGGRLISRVRLRLFGRAVNELSCETLPFSGLTAQPCDGGAALALTLNSPRCGRLRLEVDQLQISDLLGLFCKTLRLNAHAATLILPDTFEIGIELTAHDLPFPDSDEFSADRSGSDPSELFGIRDYREGDTLKSIHWKLSEKLERTVVREMSLPVSHAILLLLDNCPETTISPDAACDTCEALISCSQALADLGVLHQLAWLNHESGEIEYRTIATLDDLYGEQGALLSAHMACSEGGILPRLIAQDPPIYSHMLIFAAVQPNGIDALGGRVTLLLPESAPENAVSCLRDMLSQLMV